MARREYTSKIRENSGKEKGERGREEDTKGEKGRREGEGMVTRRGRRREIRRENRKRQTNTK